jgi:hypothetical protein
MLVQVISGYLKLVMVGAGKVRLSGKYRLGEDILA